MRDSIGNKISEKDLVKWDMPKDLTTLLAQVVGVSDGGLVTPEGTRPAILQLIVTIPVNMNGVVGEPTVTEFTCVRNPNSESLIDKFAGSVQ